MKRKLFSLLVLLMTAVSGAWAQQKYNVTFSGFDNASCNTTITDVTLPYSKSFGKTDACSNAYDIDGSSNNDQFVGASFGGDNFTITVKSAFEGTITVRVGGETDLFDPYSRNITVACVPAAPPFDYTFSVADCDHGTGTVKFFIDEKEVKGAYQADEGKTVTMTVTPEEGYVVGSVTANAYTTWAGARRKAPAAIPMLGNVTLASVGGKANTWTFTMPAASVELKVGYLATSNLFLSEEALKDKANIAVTAGKTTVEFDDKGKSTTTVIEGNTVTTKYNGTKKILGMKAVKKAPAPAAKAAAEATAEDKGKLIGADGNIYDDADAATAANTTAVAKIIYIGETGHATYNHGLALALTDEGQMTWEAAKTACNTTKNTSTPVTDARWLLASKEQWDYMLGTNGAGGYTALRDGFSGIAGASNLQSREYWSSTEVDYNGIDQVDSGYARFYIFNYGGIWSYDGKGSGYRVRACLAF